MNKEVTIKLIKGEQVSQQELLQFISDYIEFKGKPIPTSEQLSGIFQLIQMGIFKLNDAIKEAAIKLNLEVNYLTDLNNNLIKTYVYE